MSKVKLLILIGVISFLFGCNRNFISIDDVCSKYRTKVPDPSEYPNSEAVIIFEKTDWEIEINERFGLDTSRQTHVIKRIFKNLNKHSTIKIPIYEGDEVVEISARAIKPDGTVITVPDEDIFTIEGVEGEVSFYSDIKYKKFTFPGLEEGSIIEYYYRKFVKFPFFREIWVLQNDIPILYSEYSLILPEILDKSPTWDWRFKIYNDSSIGDCKRAQVLQNIDSNIDKQIMYHWIKRDAVPFKYEPLMPSGLSEVPHVKFSSAYWKKWNDLSRWYYSMFFKPKFVVSEKINQKAKELTEGTENDIDKIIACYDYVKDLRYISINLNNAGISPNRPEVVLDNKYGDCKDKSILLMSLLSALNITTEPVLLLTNNEGFFDKNFPSWNFNHMILSYNDVSGKRFWMDPTAKYSKFGNLPAMDQDVDALVLHADSTSSIIRTQKSKCNENQKEVDILIDIEKDLQCNLNLKIKYSGQERSNIKSLIDNTSSVDMDNIYKSMFSNEFLNVTIDSVFYNDSIENDTFTLSFLINNLALIQEQGELYLMEYNLLPFISNIDWLVLDERQHPLVFQYPNSIKKNITIKYPYDYLELKTIPNNCNEKKRGLISYEQNIIHDNKEINITKELNIISKEISPTNYKKFRNVFEILQKQNKEQLIFTRKS